MHRLQDTTALVTGGTSGIGRAIAIAMAVEGAHVVIGGRDATRGAATVESIRAAGGRAEFVPGDLGGGSEAVRTYARAALAALGGRIDVLVNNAGIFPATPTLAVDDATFAAVMEVNVHAPLVLVQEVVPAMVARGTGAVVTVGSWVAQVGIAAGSLYAASKATVEQLTRSWAAEFGPDGVRFNAVAPGVTLTDGTAAAEDFLDRIVASMPAGRTARPEEIAAAVVFLASEEASYMHGATLVVDGGAIATRP